MSEPQRKEIISARITGDELKLLQEAAGRVGVTISTFIREAVLAEALRSKPGAQTKRLPNGAELIWWTNAPGLVQAG